MFSWWIYVHDTDYFPPHAETLITLTALQLALLTARAAVGGVIFGVIGFAFGIVISVFIHHGFAAADVVRQEQEFCPFIPARNLLGKAVAVFWPVIDPFRWKLIR